MILIDSNTSSGGLLQSLAVLTVKNIFFLNPDTIFPEENCAVVQCFSSAGGDQSCTQFSRFVLRYASGGGSSHPPYLLAMPLLLQHQMLMALAAASPRVAAVPLVVPQGPELFCISTAQASRAQPGWLFGILPSQYMTVLADPHASPKVKLCVLFS